MELDNFIQTAMRRVLKNPILTVLKDINFSSILATWEHLGKMRQRILN
ncbi:hypothetical protein [Aliarcobacter cryaerophilus]